MSLQVVNIDLLTEDGRTLLCETGGNFLIVDRKFVEVSGGGGYGWWLPDNNNYWEHNLNKNIQKSIKFVIRYGKSEWVREYVLEETGHSIKVAAVLLRLMTSVDKIKVLGKFTKYFTKSIEIFARKK